MEVVIIISAIAAIAGLVWFLKRQVDETLKYIRDRLSDMGIDWKIYARFKFTIVTPGGAEILSTVDIPMHFREAYDGSILRMIDNHKRAYPDKPVPDKISDYPAIIIDPMTTNRENDPGSPALLVSGYQTAGTVIGTAVGSKVSPPRLVIPHQSLQGWAYLNYFASTVYNEGEHSAEARYDREVYQRYMGGDDQHPHVADES